MTHKQWKANAASAVICLFLIAIGASARTQSAPADKDNRREGLFIDITPPETHIINGPANGSQVPGSTIKFAWDGSDDESPSDSLWFSYKYDDQPWSDWKRERLVAIYDVTFAQHVFQVKARDLSGNEDESPASITFSIIRSIHGLTFSSDYIIVPGSPNYSFGSGDFTLELWCKPTQIGGDYRMLLCNRSLDNFQFNLTPGGAIQYYGGGSNRATSANLSWNLSQWYHIAWTRQNGSIKIYRDGVQVASGSYSGSTGNSTNLEFGFRTYYGSYYHPWIGDIDEVRLWKVARSQEDILQNMGRELPSDAASDPNLVGYWKLNEGAGQIANDNSLNHNHAQLGSGSAVDARDPQWATPGAPINYDPGEYDRPNTYIVSGPEEGSHHKETTVTFRWSGSDDSTPTDELEFSYRLDESIWSSFDTITSVTLEGLEDGQHRFDVRARDADLNEDSSPVRCSFVIDATPPNSTIVSGPSNGGWINSQAVAFGWVGEDSLSPTDSIWFSYRLDTMQWSEYVREKSVILQDLSVSMHVFEVRAKDLAGNIEVTPASTSFSLDLEPPNTWITSGQSTGAVIDTSVIRVSWAGSDDSAAIEQLNYSYKLDETAFSPFLPDTFHLFTGLSDGLHLLIIKARDLAGNEDPSPDSLLFIIDAHGPDAVISCGPTQEEHIDTSYVRLCWRADDVVSPVEGIQYSYRMDQDTFTTFGSDTTANYILVQEGVHYFELRAMDQIGHITELSRSFIIDMTEPNTLIVSGPTNGGYANSTTVTFELSATDSFSSAEDCQYKYKIDNEDWAQFSSERDITIEGLNAGWHLIQVKARDKAGNEEISPAVVNFFVDLNKPETQITGGPEPGNSVFVRTVTFEWAGTDIETNQENLMYAYELDGAGFSEYSTNTMVTFENLYDGVHVFVVRTRDLALNVDATPDSVLFFIESQTGACLNFDGSNDYVDVGKQINVTNNFTMELWVYAVNPHEIDGQSTSGVAGTSGQEYAISPAHGDRWGGSGHAGAGISVGTNGVSVYEHAAGYMPALLAWDGSLSGWTHIAIVYQNKQPTLYINGEYKKTGLTSPRTYVHAGLGRCDWDGIGGHYYGYFQGRIDEVRIWNYARSQAEILSVFNRELQTVEISDIRLAGYWRFNEGSGQSTSDLSIHWNDGRLGSSTGTDSQDPVWLAQGAPIASANSRLPETVIISGPGNDGYYDLSSVDFEWIGSDDSTDVATLEYSYRLDNGFWSSFSPNTSNYFSSISEGWHMFEVKARDEDFNEDPSPASSHFAIDRTPPNTVRISGPENGHWMNIQNVAFELGGTDNLSPVDSLKYSFKLDEEDWGNYANQTSATYTDLAETTHVFMARARDIVAREDLSPLTINFHIDLTPPETQVVLGPGEGSIVNSLPVRISWTGFDDRAPREQLLYNAKIDGANVRTATPDTSYTFSTLGDGEHVFTIAAQDLAKNLDESPDSLLFTLDASGPVVTIVGQTGEGEHIPVSEVVFVWTATDAVSPRDSLSFSYELINGESSAWGQDTTCSLSSLDQGFYTFRALAKDQRGHTGFAERQFAVDWTEPNTDITDGPGEGEILTGTSASFSWNGTDNISSVDDLQYSYRLDGSEDDYSEWTHNKSITLTNLGEGSHRFYVKAMDKAGNIDGSPQSVQFAVGFVDLVGQEIQIPENALLARQIQTAWKVKNNGNGPALNSWNDAVYLSSDNQIGNDIFLGRYQQPGPLSPGSSYENTQSPLVPAVLPAGNYWIVVKLDEGNVINEVGGETNNSFISQNAVVLDIPPHPDLQVASISHPSSAWSGQGMEVTWTIQNKGDYQTSGSWKEYVYLSADTIPASDERIATFSYTYGLDSMESYTHIHPTLLPEDIQGDFYIIIQTDGANNVPEYEDESNNYRISALPIHVNSTPFPDLQVDSVQVTVTASAGEVLDVEWIVSNHSDSAATSSPIWYDALYLSTDQVLGNDTYLKKVSNVTYLNPGTGYTNSTQFTLPYNIAGDHYIIVKTDCDNHVDEHHNEENNARASNPTDVEYRHKPRAVLEATFVPPFPPSTVWSGQPITFSWKVTNTGDAPMTCSSWEDAFIISEGTTFNPSLENTWWFITHEACVTHSIALQPGQSETLTCTKPLPTNLDGDYYLLVRGDVMLKCSEGSTTGIWPIHVNPAPTPDLEVTAFSTGADSLISGGYLDVQWTVMNQGPGPSNTTYWKDNYYLSQDAVFDLNSDRYLTYFAHSGYLNVDESYSTSNKVNIPSGLVGLYYIFVYTDGGKNVNENDENNNLSYQPIQILNPPGTNLQIASLETTGPASSGKPLTFSWTVLNSGPNATTADNWTDKVYLSADTTIVPTLDLLLGTKSHSGVLDKGESYIASGTATIPNGTQGEYYLIGTTDVDNLVFEPDHEDDNTRSVYLPVQLTPPPDLRVTELLSPTTPWYTGLKASVQWTVNNLGTGGTVATSWTDRIYLSSDTLLSTSTDYALGSSSHSGALGVSQFYQMSKDVTVPANYTGTRYILVRTDADNQVYEHVNEGNNIKWYPVVVQNPVPVLPDLEATNISYTAKNDGTCSVSWTVRNNGTVVVPKAQIPWLDRIYLSQDDVLNTSQDILVTSFSQSSSPNPSASYTRNETVRLPNGTDGGYYLFVYADGGNKVTEENENNNTKSMAIHVDHLPPDLVVTSVNAPDSAISGQQANIKWTVTNAGTGPTYPHSWHDGVYLSRDQILDETDVILKSEQHSGWIGADSTYQDSVNVDIPTGSSGQYYIYVTTDKDNAVYEYAYNDNNTARTVIPFEIVIPPPADLTITAIEVDTNGISGEEFQVNWTTVNIGANTASGTWIDAIYISSDSIYDSSDIMFGKLEYSDYLPPGAYKQNTVKFLTSEVNKVLETYLPGIIPDHYSVIVRTDVRNNIPEADESNNDNVSTNQVYADMVELILNTPHNFTIELDQKEYYKISITTGLDLRVRSYSDEEFNIYARFEAIPSRIEYDYISSDIYDNITELTVPSTLAGTYYIMIEPKNNIDTSVDAQLIATTVDFSIESVIPSTLECNNSTTIDIFGSHFNGCDSSMSVEIIDTDDLVVADAKNIYFHCASNISATFELASVPVGEYKLRVKKYYHNYEALLDTSGTTQYIVSESVTWDGTIYISEASGNNNMRTFVDYPNVLRPNQEFSFSVRYQNVSKQDITAPVVIVKVASEGQEPYFIQQFLATPKKSPFNVLSPEDQNVKYFRIKAPQIPGDFTISTAIISDGELPTSYASDFVNSLFGDTTSAEALNAIETLDNLFGDTWAAFNESIALEANAILQGYSSPMSLTEILLNIINLNSTETLGLSTYHDSKYSYFTMDDNLMLDSKPEENSGIWDDYCVPPWPTLYSDAWLKILATAIAYTYYEGTLGRYTLATNTRAFLTGSGQVLHTNNIATNKISSNWKFGLKIHWPCVGQVVTNHIEALSKLNSGQYGNIDYECQVLRFWEHFFWGEEYDLAVGIGGFWINSVRAVGKYSRNDNVGIIEGRIYYNLFDVFEPSTEMHAEYCIMEGLKLKYGLTYPTIYYNFSIPFAQYFELDDDEVNEDGLSSNDPPGSPVIDSDDDWRGAGSVVAPLDPNEKYGPSISDSNPFITTYSSLPYSIYFENIETASAPAQRVVISDQLDNNLDWRKFRLGEIVFSDTSIAIPPNRSYHQETMSLPDGYLLELTAGIDIASGEARWEFNSINPLTGLPPLDPLTGFLPPNDSTGIGEGHVSFTIMADPDVPEGTEIRNSALIVFDDNEAIQTNEVMNIIRYVYPDLLVSSANGESETSSFLEGEELTLYAEVSNLGEKKADSYSISFYEGDPQMGGILIETKNSIAVLDTGAIQSATVSWTPERILGQNDIHIAVDYDNDVEEVDETNNSRVLALSVEPRTYSVFLQKDINLVSLPLEPIEQLEARSFCSLLDATMVIRYDSEGLFESYIPSERSDDGFPIEPHKGYLAVLPEEPEEKEVTFTGMTNLNTMALSAGMNFISLPLYPETTYTARRFSEKLDANMLIQYNNSLGVFEAFIPEFDSGDGFDILGARGYFAILDSDTTVAFDGKGWLGTEDQPPGGYLTANAKEKFDEGTFVLGISGSLYSEIWGKKVPVTSEYFVDITQARSGVSVPLKFNSTDGIFSGAFVDFMNTNPIFAGDTLRINIRDKKHQPVGDPVEYIIEKTDIQRHYVTLSAEISGIVPTATILYQNFPNPFNPSTRIRYQISEPGRVDLRVYNVAGQLIKTLVDKHQNPGYYEIVWQGENNRGNRVASGVYFYKLDAQNYSKSRKLVILR